MDACRHVCRHVHRREYRRMYRHIYRLMYMRMYGHMAPKAYQFVIECGPIREFHQPLDELAVAEPERLASLDALLNNGRGLDRRKPFVPPPATSGRRV